MPIVMLIHQVCWKKSKLPDDTLWAEIKRMIKVHDLPWIRKKNYQIRNFITKLVSSWLHIVMPIVMLIHQVCWKKSKLPDDTLWAEIERIIEVHDLPWIGKKWPNKKLHNQTRFIIVAHCYAYWNVHPSSLLEKLQTSWWNFMSWDWKNNQGPWFTMNRKKIDRIKNSITKLVSLWLHIFMPIVMLIHQVCWKKSKLPDDTLWAEIERIIKVHDLPWIGKKYSNFFKKEKKNIKAM